MNNNIHYLIIALALLFAIVAIIKPLTWPLAVSVLLICIELFSRVSKVVIATLTLGVLLAGVARAQTIPALPNIIGGTVFTYQGQTFYVSTNGNTIQVFTQGTEGTNTVTVPATPAQAMEVATAWLQANNPANTNYYADSEIEARLGAGYLQNSGQAVAAISVEKWGLFKSQPEIGFGAGVLQGNNAGKSGTAGAYGEADYRKVIGDDAVVVGVLVGYDNWNTTGFAGAKVGIERRQSAHLGEFLDAAYCFEKHSPDSRGLLVFAGVAYAF